MNRVGVLGVIGMNWLAWLGVVPGIASLAWSLISYGMLLNRVKNVEVDVDNIQKELAELRATRETVARIDERTDNIKEQVREISGKLNDVTGAFLRTMEPRTFAEGRG